MRYASPTDCRRNSLTERFVKRRDRIHNLKARRRARTSVASIARIYRLDFARTKEDLMDFFRISSLRPPVAVFAASVPHRSGHRRPLRFVGLREKRGAFPDSDGSPENSLRALHKSADRSHLPHSFCLSPRKRINFKELGILEMLCRFRRAPARLPQTQRGRQIWEEAYKSADELLRDLGDSISMRTFWSVSRLRNCSRRG